MTMPDPQWPERPINSLQEFHEIVAAIGAHWPNTDRCLFRGQAQSAWTLLPTLARETAGGKFGWQEIIRLELELMRNFRQEAHRTLPQAVLPRRDYILDWWPLMQHYGAPTRLLDWSLSPYVALYFAVDRHWEEDGTVWWFKAATSESLMLQRFTAHKKNGKKLYLTPKKIAITLSWIPHPCSSAWSLSVPSIALEISKGFSLFVSMRPWIMRPFWPNWLVTRMGLTARK
jgi:hypothetical protein